MPLTALENELRVIARTLIQQGRLPSIAPSRVWGGFGHGENCSLCAKVLNTSDVAYEIEERIEDTNRLYRFHFICHAAWQFECAREEHIRQTDQKP